MQTKSISFIEAGQVRVKTSAVEWKINRPTEIIVRNWFSLISAGTELACLGGGEWWFPLPAVPGYASVGEVVELGSDVTKVSRGDVVLTHGPHASQFKIDTTDRYSGTCVKLPSGLPPELAPLVRLASIAIASIRVAVIELGDVVLVTGLGLVGNLAAQLAGLQGARVIATDLSEKRRAVGLATGIPAVIDGRAPDWKDTVRRLAGARGVSTYIDATGVSAVITETSQLVAPYGETILLGTPRTPHESNVTEIYHRIHQVGFTTFKGALEWRFPTFRGEFGKHSIERNTEILLELAAENKLQLAPLLTHRLSPEQAPEIYAQLVARKDESCLGVIFDWRN